MSGFIRSGSDVDRLNDTNSIIVRVISTTSEHEKASVLLSTSQVKVLCELSDYLAQVFDISSEEFKQNRGECAKQGQSVTLTQ